MGSAITSDTWRAFYHQIRAVNFAQLGESEAAQREIDNTLELRPGLSLEAVRQMFSIANNHPENREFWLESLELAGLPAS